MSAPTPAAAPSPRPGVPPAARVPSIDAFRGLVMFLMLAEVMRLWTLHDAFPSSTFWAIVAFNTTHVPWQGCSLHDLIQPAFSFLAGASLPFSIASRRAKGQSFQSMLGHVNLDSTQVYTYLSVMDLKDVHKRCHPREKDNR